MDRIILCDTRDKAYALTEHMYDEVCARNPSSTPKSERTTKYLLGVHENILSSQFGLHVPLRMWDSIDESYKVNVQLWNPLWVNEKFINGEPSFIIGNGPFGFGVGMVEPQKVRGILEGNYSQRLIKQVRESGRKYTIEVHNLAKQAILDMQEDQALQKHLLNTINPYMFEELIAELLRSQGFEVFLTKKSGDEGRDIIAAFYEDGHEHLMMVECKRRRDGTILDSLYVSALVGQFYIEKVQNTGFTCAMLVTSADGFGPTPINNSIVLRERVYELSLKGRTEIVEWINDYGEFKNGLWVPKRFKELF